MAWMGCATAYAGVQCAECHPQEAARFLASPMGRSLSAPTSLPTGRVRHQQSGSEISIEARGGKMIQRLSENGLTAEYPVAYQIGSGRKGSTYAIEIANYLLESPVSWYRDHGWDMSPGYEAMPVIDFDRPVSYTCLFCHAGEAKFSDADKRRVARGSLTAITCERCHGDGEQHKQNPSASNIVNPAHLTAAARNSVCEQCHLEGDARIANPGGTGDEFRPGAPLEGTLVTYLFQEARQIRPAVSQVEELATSRCVQASGDRLWCGSCHQPHGKPTERASFIKAVCTSCHESLSPTSHGANVTECVSCHMPARATSNISHVSVTDHRIQRPHSTTPSTTVSTDSIAAWRLPPLQFRQRDLALAQLQIGAERQRPEMIEAGVRLLQSLPDEQQNDDPAALSLLQSIFLNKSDPAKAVALSEWAAKTEPRSATFAMNLGIAFKRAGNMQEAEKQLLRAITLDESMMQAYAELAVLYDNEQRPDEARKTIERFLAWNPQSIQFRLARRP